MLLEVAKLVSAIGGKLSKVIVNILMKVIPYMVLISLKKNLNHSQVAIQAVPQS